MKKQKKKTNKGSDTHLQNIVEVLKKTIKSHCNLNEIYIYVKNFYIFEFIAIIKHLTDKNTSFLLFKSIWLMS